MSVELVSERLSGWGRYPVVEGNAVHPADAGEMLRCTSEASRAIARGNGRSYGDASLGIDLTLCTGRLDRFLSFDPTTGSFECEAGVMLSDILDIMLPRGFFVPVTPGTRFVTIGGMVSSDVHGKNHHGAGSFCDHVDWIDVSTGTTEMRCSRTENSELFAATCGGLGLTGVILRVSFKMQKVETSAIRQRTVRAPNLASALETFESTLDWTYSVAWIDCMARGDSLGRSAIFLGEHALLSELPDSRRDAPFSRKARRPKRIPMDAPRFALSTAIVRAFNAVYFAAQADGETLVDLEPYFYPLDAVLDWNRIYGRRGFVQYQCVLPLEVSAAGLRELLGMIAVAGGGSFLAVLKRMGRESFGLLSFPRTGYTLALDFPTSPANLALLDRLDEITLSHGGRIYLAKDARAKPSFALNYDRIDRFRAVRRQLGLVERFSSHLSDRLGI